MAKPPPVGMDERLRRMSQDIARIEGRGPGQRFDVGHVALFAIGPVPLGWLPMNGAMVSTEDYPLLWFKLGTTFGATTTVSGVLQFKLPTMAAPANFVYGIRALN